MKVIIPLAGKGTRLRPHTHITPKPMLKVAGKPVMDYVMDDVAKLKGVEQVVYITGHLKEKVEAHARDAYKIPGVFVEQQVQEALGYADRALVLERGAVAHESNAQNLREDTATLERLVGVAVH